MHACGVTVDGDAYCWGANELGQLGTGLATEPVLTPVRVSGDLTVLSVSAGLSHTCSVVSENNDERRPIYCWGANDLGQLGTGSITGPEACGGVACSTVPIAHRGSFFSVSAGIDPYTCGVADGSLVECWGAERLGRLGIGEDALPECAPTIHCAATPTLVHDRLDFFDVTTGGYLTCGKSDTPGGPWCWGSNEAGALGTGSFTGPERCGPEATPCSVSAVEIAGNVGLNLRPPLAVGRLHACGVAILNSPVFCWGANESGQLGNGTRQNRASPTPVASFPLP